MGTKENVEKLNANILNGKVMEGFEELYADDVVMQENNEEPRVGKEVNREFEKKFMENVEEFHGAKVNSVSIGKDSETGDELSTVEWFMDVTFKDGNRKKMTQVAVQRWKNDKIVNERFYYDPAGMK